MATLKRKVLKDNKLPKKLQVYPSIRKGEHTIIKLEFFLAIPNAEGSKENN